MDDALFSDFLMVDAGSTVSTAKAARKRFQRVGTPRNSVAGELDQAALVTALDAAVASKLQHDETLAAGPPVDWQALFADIVAGRSVILRLSSEVTGSRRAAVKTFLENLIRITGTLETSRQETAIERLAELILPDDLAAARGPLAADNLKLRDRFISETAHFTSAEVAAHAGHKSNNSYATATRWKKAGDIFSVHHRGTEYFPSFQFRDGRPHPTIKKVLAVLPSGRSPWQRAFWFVSTNGWLEDAAPADRLDEPDAVVAAARHESLEVMG
jgi:hypothetical protein